MTPANRPSVRMRRIGSALRKAREDNAMTLDTASRRYGRSKGWLSTLENGLHTIDPQELADLLDFYGVAEEALRQSLIHLARRTPSRSWERSYEGRISAAALDLASLEADAALIRNFEPCVAPGLLQIPAYTRALVEVGTGGTPRAVRTLVDFRMTRQEVLHRPEPPRYIAIISESVLHHQVGGPSTMKAQLLQLADVSALPHVTLRVLPNSASQYLCLAGSFHLIALRPPGSLTVSVVEQFASSLFIEDGREVAAHEKVFDRLMEASLGEEASNDLVNRITSRIWTSQSLSTARGARAHTVAATKGTVSN